MWFDKEIDDRIGFEEAEKYRDFLNESGREILPFDDPIVVAVETVLKQLFQGVSHLGFKFEVCIFEDFAKSEACTITGGRIFLSTERLSKLKSAEQLAALLSHEMSHEISRHVMEERSAERVLVFLTTLLRQHVLPEGHNPSVTVQNRLFELECDKMGLQIMANAGFNPQESIKLMREEAKRDRAQEKQDARRRLPESVRIHPLWATRIEHTQLSLADAKATFAKHTKPMPVTRLQLRDVFKMLSARCRARVAFLREAKASIMPLSFKFPQSVAKKLDIFDRKLSSIFRANPSMMFFSIAARASNKDTSRTSSESKTDDPIDTKVDASEPLQIEQVKQPNATENESDG